MAKITQRRSARKARPTIAEQFKAFVDWAEATANEDDRSIFPVIAKWLLGKDARAAGLDSPILLPNVELIIFNFSDGSAVRCFNGEVTLVSRSER